NENPPLKPGEGGGVSNENVFGACAGAAGLESNADGGVIAGVVPVSVENGESNENDCAAPFSSSNVNPKSLACAVPRPVLGGGFGVSTMNDGDAAGGAAAGFIEEIDFSSLASMVSSASSDLILSRLARAPAASPFLIA